MVGTVSLEDYRGLPVVGRIAVSQAYRESGLGRRLLTTLEGEARRRRLTELWATARAPGFFVAMGYSVVAIGKERRPAAVGMLHLWPVRQGMSPAGGAQDVRAVASTQVGARLFRRYM